MEGIYVSRTEGYGSVGSKEEARRVEGLREVGGTEEGGREVLKGVVGLFVVGKEDVGGDEEGDLQVELMVLGFEVGVNVAPQEGLYTQLAGTPLVQL